MGCAWRWRRHLRATWIWRVSKQEPACTTARKNSPAQATTGGLASQTGTRFRFFSGSCSLVWCHLVTVRDIKRYRLTLSGALPPDTDHRPTVGIGRVAAGELRHPTVRNQCAPCKGGAFPEGELRISVDGEHPFRLNVNAPSGEMLQPETPRATMGATTWRHTPAPC